MEFRPYSLAENYLLVTFAGLPETVTFGVSATTAEETLAALTFPVDDDGEPADEPPLWIRVPLADGSLALLDREHLTLVTHSYEYGLAEGPPPPGVYGAAVPERVAEEHEWAPPVVTIGIEGIGVLDLYDQTRETAETLPGTVPEGFLFAPFFAFTDDDGERNVVATDRVAFVVLHPDVL